jgi:hypothetical protein
MNDIDALTLQLLSSKKRYNKYLESAQPNKSNEIQEFYGKIRKYKSRILQTVEKYLDTPETQTTTDVDESIEACFKTLIRHYEILNKERKAYLKDYDEDDSTDEEEVFGQTKEEAEAEEAEEAEAEAEEAEAEAEEPTNKKPQVSSFWGNQITKTPSPNLDAFIIKKSKNK